MTEKEYKQLLSEARQWWRTLSIKEGKELALKHKAVVVNGWPLPSWLIEMYELHRHK